MYASRGIVLVWGSLKRRRGLLVYSIPKPDIIILRSDIMKTRMRMMSFKMMAARWSFCLFMFRPPIITKRIATISCKDKDTKKIRVKLAK